MVVKKKLYSDFQSVTSNQLTDQIPVKQGGENKVTDLQKIKTLLDTYYASLTALNNEIANRQAGDTSTLNAAKAYADGLVVSVFRPAGGFDASGGDWPTTGTGEGGAIRSGDTYNVTVGDSRFDVGDNFYALVDDPGQIDANWTRFEYNTQQATEGERGTARVATASEVSNQNSSNDTDLITPQKFWIAAKTVLFTISEFVTAVAGAAIQNLTGDQGRIVAGEALNVMLSKLQSQADLALNVSNPIDSNLQSVRVNIDTIPMSVATNQIRFDLSPEIANGYGIIMYAEGGEKVLLTISESNEVVITPI